MMDIHHIKLELKKGYNNFCQKGYIGNMQNKPEKIIFDPQALSGFRFLAYHEFLLVKRDSKTGILTSVIIPSNAAPLFHASPY